MVVSLKELRPYLTSFDSTLYSIGRSTLPLRSQPSSAIRCSSKPLALTNEESNLGASISVHQSHVVLKRLKWSNNHTQNGTNNGSDDGAREVLERWRNEVCICVSVYAFKCVYVRKYVREAGSESV